MIDVKCIGKHSTFVVPVDETQFSNFQRATWDGEKIKVYYQAPYNSGTDTAIVFGWTRRTFGDCCGADQVTDFSYMIYNEFGLKDSSTPINKEKETRYKEFWEPWYKEVVREGHKPAIGLIPSTINGKNEIVERSEFYSWLKSKGTFLSQWKNMIYADSIIGAYLFVPEGSRLMEMKWGSFK